MYAFLGNCWTLAWWETATSLRLYFTQGLNMTEFLLICPYLLLLGKKWNLNKCLSNIWLNKLILQLCQDY